MAVLSIKATILTAEPGPRTIVIAVSDDEDIERLARRLASELCGWQPTKGAPLTHRDIGDESDAREKGGG